MENEVQYIGVIHCIVVPFFLCNIGLQEQKNQAFLVLALIVVVKAEEVDGEVVLAW